MLIWLKLGMGLLGVWFKITLVLCLLRSDSLHIFIMSVAFITSFNMVSGSQYHLT